MARRLRRQRWLGGQARRLLRGGLLGRPVVLQLLERLLERLLVLLLVLVLVLVLVLTLVRAMVLLTVLAVRVRVLVRVPPLLLLLAVARLAVAQLLLLLRGVLRRRHVLRVRGGLPLVLRRARRVVGQDLPRVASPPIWLELGLD